MKASDVMTWGTVTIPADASVVDAARKMLDNRISGLPVVDRDGHLIGIVTEGDLLRRSELGTQRRRPRWLEFLIGPGRLADEYVHSSGRKVSEIMTPDPKTITPSTPLDTVVQLMEKHRVKRLPVVEGGRLLGIVSRANLVHALASLARVADPNSANDGIIRERLLAELGKHRWAPEINVVVRDGVVDLWGVLTDEREREAFIVAAENVDGVKQVHDHLVWIDPVSGFVLQSVEDEKQTPTP